MDRRQRGDEEGRLGDVVESDDAHVRRHSHAALVEGVQHAERHLVVRGEHRGDVGVRGELESGLVAGVGAPVAAERGWRRDARSRQARLPALDALARLEPVGRTGHMPDGPVPERKQVVDRQPGARELVDRHDRDLAAVPGLDGDHGQPGPQVAEPTRGTLARRDDDHAVDGLPRERVDGRADRRRIEICQAADGDRVPRRPRRMLDGEQCRRRAEQPRVEADHADRLRPAGDQPAGQRVGTVVEPADRLEDSLPGLRTHVGVAVEDA